jgi:hypothetical protein
MDPEVIRIQEEILRLKEDKADREKALPAHSIRPNQLLVIEEMEEEISRLEEELRMLSPE